MLKLSATVKSSPRVQMRQGIHHYNKKEFWSGLSRTKVIQLANVRIIQKVDGKVCGMATSGFLSVISNDLMVP